MKARQRHGEMEEERERKDRQTHSFIILNPKTSAEASHRHTPSVPPLQAPLPLHLHSTDTRFPSQCPQPAASKVDRSTARARSQHLRGAHISMPPRSPSVAFWHTLPLKTCSYCHQFNHLPISDMRGTQGALFWGSGQRYGGVRGQLCPGMQTQTEMLPAFASLKPPRGASPLSTQVRTGASK